MNVGVQEALVPAESRYVTVDTVTLQLSCRVSLANICCLPLSFFRVLQVLRATKDQPVHRSVFRHRESLQHQEDLEPDFLLVTFS